MLGVGSTHGLEAGATGLVLKYPARGKAAVLDLLQYPAHLITHMLIDDARARDIVAELGGIADGVAHVAHAALVHQVHDELHLVHAFKVGYFRLIAGLHERLEARTDQRGDTTAENRLLAKEVGFGFLGNRGAQHTGTCATNRTSIGEGQGLGITGGILVDSPQGGNAYALGEEAAHHVTGAFGCNHCDIDVGRRQNLRVVQAEAVRCHQHLAGSKPRANITLKHFAVMLIGDENHDDIGLLSSACRCRHLQALGLSLLAALTAGR